MKTLLYIKAFLFAILLVCANVQVNAQKVVYVALTTDGGNGTGTDENNPVLFSTFRTNSANYLAAGENHVFFKGGTYIMNTNSPIAIGSSYSVHFSPIDSENKVIFDGSSTNVRFVNVSGVLQVSDITLQNFVASSSDHETGGSSLFAVSTNASVKVENCIIRNVGSRRNPLVALLAEASFEVSGSEIDNIYITGGTYALMESYIANCSYIFRNSTLKNMSTQLSGQWGNIFWFENTHQTLVLDNCIITGNKYAVSFIGSYAATSNITVTSCEFSNNTASNTNSTYRRGLFFDTGYDYPRVETMTISDCIFKNNTGSDRPLIRLQNGDLTVSGCTFSGNSNVSDIIAFTSVAATTGNKIIYNNTFSGNSVTNTLNVTYNTSGNFFNNTIYNSGNVTLSNGNYNVQNNLLISGSLSGTSIANARRNIANNTFYASGTSGGVSLGGTIQNHVNTTLTTYEEGKPQVHELIISSSGTNPILEKGGPTSGTEFGNNVTYDQRGRKRPENISIGAWDLAIFGATTGNYTILYDPEEGLHPPYIIDLSDYISSYPDGANKSNITYTVIRPADSGISMQVSLEPPYQLSFTPHMQDGPNGLKLPIDGIVGVSYPMIYRVSFTAGGITFERDIVLNIKIVNTSLPMGIIDQTIIRCYEEMGQVAFVPQWKYRTYHDNLHNRKFRYDGFSIPLVGDLNGDGKPEVVVLGLNDPGEGIALYGWARYIYILNGQTGTIIAKFPIDKWTIRDGSVFHNSPSFMALVDADRNGRAEIILCYGNTSTSMSKKVVSYEVNENTFLPETSLSITDTKRLTKKWESKVRYDAYGNGNSSSHNSHIYFAKPVPQIVDINNDGNPEILVYNKIYSASTGDLLVTLGDLGGSGTATYHTTYANYKNYAFVGRNRHTTYMSDSHVNFSSVYDLDGDGTMEVIAGGKVYYDINLQTDSYSELSAENIPDIFNSGTYSIGDGYTGVADIDGDGKAEIVVVNTVLGSNQMNISVWDPGFLKEENGKWVKQVPNKANARLLAQANVPYSYQERQGSNSYVYIGDIDGKIQNGKKLPEISVLGPRFYSSGNKIPLHPNVSSELLSSGLISNNNVSYTTTAPISQGALMSWTWDNSPNINSIQDRLKVSFILEHADRSLNTGFTLFDFDNDGAQEICYRDEINLRIISAKRSYIKLKETSSTAPDVIRFSQTVKSFTGFEYPVIADIDGDGSADVIVMGANGATDNSTSSRYDDANGYLYAVQTDLSISKVAPAPMVWNQFMYHPLKINEDLTIPSTNLHPLSDKLKFVKETEKNSGIETYIYNNTITQAVISAVFDDVNQNGDSIKVLKPMVPIPDAKVEGEIFTGTNPTRLTFYITNTGNATLNGSTPIRLYRDSVSGNTRLTKIGNVNVPTTLGKDIFVGDTLVITFTGLSGNELGYNYICRVADPSPISGTFTDLFMTQYSDCNWADNVVEVGTFVVRNDAATIIQYGEVIIDVLANDLLPDDLPKVLTADMVTQPEGGKVEVVNNKIRYTAPAQFAKGVDEFTYSITYETLTKTARVYVYVLQSETGDFTTCQGGDYSPELMEIPEDIVFKWYTKDMNYIGEEAPVIQNITSDQTYYVKPDFTKVTATDYLKYRLVNFPEGELVVYALPATPSYTAKWKGTIDNDWHNPGNWVRLNNGVEYAIKWAPNSCVNVVIPGNLINYPELTRDASCADISLEDRAMISGIHHLTYDKAQVELTLRASEKERFVMWSAPLKGIYSGDYHITDNNGNPKWGDVYMNFFQSVNPDTNYPVNTARENAFTSTFGSLSAPLSLGKGFNIKIENRYADATFVFPKTESEYKDENNVTHTIPNRSGSHKFIIDKEDMTNGLIALPVDGDNDYHMIQVVNPFMAYLNVRTFVNTNSNALESGYRFWTGSVDEEFISVIAKDTLSPNRYLIDTDKMPLAQYEWIPPLQSFFVMKKSGQKVTHLLISSEWTSTKVNGEGDYELRSNELLQNVLRVSAMQDNQEAVTTLYYEEEASPTYNGNEDLRKLFNPESPLSVYTFAQGGEPLAINSSGDFESQKVRLAIRLKKAGKVTLTFTGMERFRHNVYLVDHDNNELTYDVSATPELTFEIEGYSTGDYIELENRFSLVFEYTGVDTGNSWVQETGLQVLSGNGHLTISANGNQIENLQVFNLWGQQIYHSRKAGTQFKVPVQQNQFYIVKGLLNNQIKITKAIGR